MLARDVKDWKPGDLTVNDYEALGSPGPLMTLAKVTYSIQAVMDLNRDARDFSNIINASRSRTE